MGLIGAILARPPRSTQIPQLESANPARPLEDASVLATPKHIHRVNDPTAPCSNLRRLASRIPIGFVATTDRPIAESSVSSPRVPIRNLGSARLPTSVHGRAAANARAVWNDGNSQHLTPTWSGRAYRRRPWPVRRCALGHGTALHPLSKYETWLVDPIGSGRLGRKCDGTCPYLGFGGIRRPSREEFRQPFLHHGSNSTGDR